MSKAKTLFKTFLQIFSAIWKLCMLGIYALAKLTEGIAKIVVKISEKFID